MFVIMTIHGRNPELPSLTLYSHTDVAFASQESWTHNPYSAFKDEHGNIFGRGAQDMKAVGSQYFEAIRSHILRGKAQWERTIHVIYGPEEENRGEFGMKTFVNTKEFENLNIGFVLDEGSASRNDRFNVFFGERSPWIVKVTISGSPGHASRFIENTAMEKMQIFLNQALKFRELEKKRKEENDLSIGEATSLNITILKGGVQANVVPEEFSLLMDMRVTPLHDLKEIEQKVNQWCEKAGNGVTYEFLEKSTSTEMTPTTDDDPWWAAFEGALKQEGCQYTKSIHPAATDSRFMRAKGIRCIGFSPMNNTPVKIHAHNEFVNEKVFLRGVEIYETLIDKLADIKEA